MTAKKEKKLRALFELCLESHRLVCSGEDCGIGVWEFDTLEWMVFISGVVDVGLKAANNFCSDLQSIPDKSVVSISETAAKKGILHVAQADQRLRGVLTPLPW